MAETLTYDTLLPFLNERVMPAVAEATGIGALGETFWTPHILEGLQGVFASLRTQPFEDSHFVHPLAEALKEGGIPAYLMNKEGYFSVCIGHAGFMVAGPVNPDKAFTRIMAALIDQTPEQKPLRKAPEMALTVGGMDL